MGAHGYLVLSELCQGKALLAETSRLRDEAEKYRADAEASAHESHNLREHLEKTRSEADHYRQLLADAQRDGKSNADRCKELLAAVEAKTEESARWQNELAKAEEEAQKNMDLLTEAMRVEADVKKRESAEWRERLAKAEADAEQNQELLVEANLLYSTVLAFFLHMPSHMSQTCLHTGTASAQSNAARGSGGI